MSIYAHEQRAIRALFRPSPGGLGPSPPCRHEVASCRVSSPSAGFLAEVCVSTHTLRTMSHERRECRSDAVSGSWMPPPARLLACTHNPQSEAASQQHAPAALAVSEEGCCHGLTACSEDGSSLELDSHQVVLCAFECSVGFSLFGRFWWDKPQHSHPCMHASGVRGCRPHGWSQGGCKADCVPHMPSNKS